MKVWIDGTYYAKEDAKISVYDHGLLYGDGVFEGIRIYGGKIFKLVEHVRRLFDSAKAIGLALPMDRAAMEKLLLEAVAVNEKHDGYIRLVATRGYGDLGVDPAKCAKASVIVIVDDIALYPAELYAKGIAVVSVASRRVAADVFDPRIKSLNYLNNVLAKIEAKLAGCLEAVLLNREGYVTECSGDNLFIVRDGVLKTPDPSCGLLAGITRQTVLDLAAANKVPAKETLLTRYDLYNADECFLTGTGAELMPVTAIDGRRIGDGTPGPITKKLLAAFREFVGVSA